jgi:hypothetical protein
VGEVEESGSLRVQGEEYWKTLFARRQFSVRLKSFHGLSAAWPTFAQRERKKKSATPVEMTALWQAG